MGRGENLLMPGMLALLLMLAPLGLGRNAAQGGQERAHMDEGPDNNYENNDDFIHAQGFTSGYFLDGTTGLNDSHGVDTYVLHDVPAGKVINASCLITDFDDRPGQGQCLQLTGWNRYHVDALAKSNSGDDTGQRPWEAIGFLCVVSGDYFIQLKPIAGLGAIDYQLNIQAFDPENIISEIGTGGAFGATIMGQVSSLKWYSGHWYMFTLNGEQNGMNDYLYVNMTEPGAPDQRLLGDIYVRDLEPESWSHWLNQSWWLDSHVQYEEVHAAACHPGTAWYYLDVEASNTSGGRSENYTLKLTKTLIESDGDNHPLNATKITFGQGKSTVRENGNVTRGPDDFDWYKLYLKQGKGVSANLTLIESSTAIFRLSIFRDNKTSPLPEPGYDLMSSWTNQQAGRVLQHVNALTTNVSQEGWYYIDVIAQTGLDPANVSNPVDWTVQTAWARYHLDIVIPECTYPPYVMNSPAPIIIPEDGSDSTLELNFTGHNNGVFTDDDFKEDWGEVLTFSSDPNPDFQITIDNNDPSAPATISPNRDWNGEANLTFTATDIYGKSNSTIVHVRVTPVEDPPFVRFRIPDFTVNEGQTNLTMKDIDLFLVFGDPDLPPFGEDNLTFTLDNSSFPSVIVDSRLTFGTAPRFHDGVNHMVAVAVTATDECGLMAWQIVNMTVLNNNRPPETNGTHAITIFDDIISYYDLHDLFWDPDGDSLNYSYIGGASGNLTVGMASDGIAVLHPSQECLSDQEILLFKASDPDGANATNTLVVNILHVPGLWMPFLVQVPDPFEQTQIDENKSINFSVALSNNETDGSLITFGWYIDDILIVENGTSNFTWKTGYDDAGMHTVKCRIYNGPHSYDFEWNITVFNVNRPPVILDSWPLNNTEVAWNAKLTFRASATDPDGDPITFYWRESDGTLLKTQTGVTSSVFSKTLSPGKQHIIMLEVQDNQGGVTRQYIYIKVEANYADQSRGIQVDFTGIYILLILYLSSGIAAMAIAVAYYWRRRGR